MISVRKVIVCCWKSDVKFLLEVRFKVFVAYKKLQIFITIYCYHNFLFGTLDGRPRVLFGMNLRVGDRDVGRIDLFLGEIDLFVGETDLFIR